MPTVLLRSVLLRVAVAAALMLGDRAVAAEPQIELVRIADDDAPELAISGEWLTGCPPLLREVRVEDRTMVLLAQPDSQRCGGEPGPYRLSAELPVEALALEGVWRVRYELRDDPLAPPRLLAFQLLSLGDDRPPTPESGLWWGEPGGQFDHASPGLSAQLERQGDLLAVTYSGYDADGGPEWLFGATSLSDASSEIELTRLEGGSGPFGGYKGPTLAQPGGRLQIEWLSSARAVFWFSRDNGHGIELQPISMVRFDFGQQPGSGGWLGRWLIEADGSAALESVDFEHVETEVDSFALFGRGGETLICLKAIDRPYSPPTSCELQFADGRSVRFDDVGLTQLRGHDADRTRVRAMPMPR